MNWYLLCVVHLEFLPHIHTPSQVAQLKHSVGQKEELLRLYARDARERDQAETEVTEDKPEWVVALTQECR